MENKRKIMSILVISAMVATMFVLTIPVAENSEAGSSPVTGAIFTTLEDGTRVNANIYQDKRDVYLDGGPGPNAPQEAAGLPDGNYYFQVTDPSGKKLLSMDPVKCREFRVEDGIIVEFVSKTNGCTYEVGNGKNGKTVSCWIDGWQHGQHDLGWDVDHGALTIQLMPYEDTPNRGGVYKVWATPTKDFDGDPNIVDNGYKPGYFHGFIPRFSKTDNFKVREKGRQPDTPEIEICKFEDLNGNGAWDNKEPTISGWMITVEDPLGVTNTYYTDEDGCVTIYAPMDGDYTITENVPSGWSITTTIVDGVIVGTSEEVTISVDARTSTSYSVAFGNFECFDVNGHKYNDLDGDGILDGGEPGIEGWKITLLRSTDGGQTWSEYTVTHTDANGYYMFEVCEGGEYKVMEESREGWIHTTMDYYTFTAESGMDHVSLDFLNFQCFKVLGYKYEDMLGNGVWDEGDPGIQGWEITLERSTDGGSSWTEYDTTLTDGNGYYEFEVCEAGMYRVSEEDRSGWTATSPTYFEFSAVSGQHRTYNFFNFAFGMICGTKWYDLNKNGVLDSEEVEVEGIIVELYRNGELVDSVETDADGSYCFFTLGPGYYEVKEVMPDSPGENLEWAPTYPSYGIWSFDLTSGANLVKNLGNIVEFTGGLSWGYWKTHTEGGPAPRDDTYDLLPQNPMPVDVETPDGDYWVNDDEDADFIYGGAGDGPASAEGDGRKLFRAQLLALHMNLLKFPGMADAVYIYPGDSMSGKTVQYIYDMALEMLNDGEEHDFHDLLATLDKINNNSHYAPGSHVLILPEPPTPYYGP
jgi:hypothetical protein